MKRGQKLIFSKLVWWKDSIRGLIPKQVIFVAADRLKTLACRGVGLVVTPKKKREREARRYIWLMASQFHWLQVNLKKLNNIHNWITYWIIWYTHERISGDCPFPQLQVVLPQWIFFFVFKNLFIWERKRERNFHSLLYSPNVPNGQSYLHPQEEELNPGLLCG